MSIRNFVPTIWSAQIFQELDTAHILVPLCNRDYEGEISNYGDTVRINSLGDITISNYAPNVTQITPQQLDAQQQVLEIDQAKYWAFYVDDVDRAQVKGNVFDEAMRKAAYALADDADQFVAAFWTDAGLTVASSSAQPANALNILSDVARELDVANVPTQGRWLVVPPWFHQHMILAEILQTQGSIDANASYRNGFVGRSFGFDVYMSNNLSTGASGRAAARSHRALAGTNRAISWANQIVKTEAYRPEDAFSDAVKGLHVYGARVIDPNALVAVNISATG